MSLHYKVTRHRSLPNAGGKTLFFKVDKGRLGRFLQPYQLPDFDGDQAWFEIEWRGGIAEVGRRTNEPGEPWDTIAKG